MNFLTPRWLLLGALSIPIILMYMLKLRREDQQVSSTFLWKMALQDRQANTPWQRLRRNLLLLLQLLILLALVIALARPTFPTDTISNSQIIVILDASASMQSTDVGLNRFEVARGKTLSLINGLQPNSEMTIILAKNQPNTIIAHSTDKNNLRDSLDTALVSYGSPNWHATFSLVNAAISTPDHTIIIFSDGGIPEAQYSLFSENIQWVRIGEEEENIGISAFSITHQSNKAELFVKITNYGSERKPAILSIFRDDTLLTANRIDVLPNDSINKVIADLPNAQANYHVELTADIGENKLDYFSADDIAYAVYLPPKSGNVLLVSSGNFFIEQFLAAMPDTKAFRILPDEISTLPQSNFSVYVLDGILPDELPAGNLLLINPPDNSLFDVQPATQEYGSIKVLDHPLTRFINWQNVQLFETSQIKLPTWGEILIDSEAGPLVFIGEYDNRRIATISFDIHDSDLPLHIAFPILFNNLINYLNPPSIVNSASGLKTEETVNINPGPEVNEIRIVSPEGNTFTYPVEETGILFSNATTPGIYTIHSGTTDKITHFAVNLFDPKESRIAPNTAVPLAEGQPNQQIQTKAGIREIWSWLALLGFIILIIEWHIYQQRHFRVNIWQSILKILRRDSAS